MPSILSSYISPACRPSARKRYRDQNGGGHVRLSILPCYGPSIHSNALSHLVRPDGVVCLEHSTGECNIRTLPADWHMALPVFRQENPKTTTKNVKKKNNTKKGTVNIEIFKRQEVICSIRQRCLSDTAKKQIFVNNRTVRSNQRNDNDRNSFFWCSSAGIENKKTDLINP